MIANGRFLYALWRKPMSVMGNGVDDVAGLLSALRVKAEAFPPWARDKVVPLDDLTRQVLLHQGMIENTVPCPVRLRSASVHPETHRWFRVLGFRHERDEGAIHVYRRG